ncbi:MAG: DNA-directed RNA polymerase subunit H [Thermoproteota archaeon]
MYCLSSKTKFNVFKHVLVPKHERLSQEEKQQVLQRYGIKPYQLPKILSSDPCVKAIGAVPGDIIRITRKSPTAGISHFYRYVVEG